MALGMVQVGYRNSLCMYSAQMRPESGQSYDEWLEELTTELGLALEGGNGEESVTDNSTEEDSGETESYSCRKKEWEDFLEHTEVVEAMLRQMLENGLGQQKESQQESFEKKTEEEPDNDFDLNGIPAAEESRQRDSPEYSEPLGNSEFLQRNSGDGSELLSLSNGGRKQKTNLHTICLFCETECEKKKLWKITE